MNTECQCNGGEYGGNTQLPVLVRTGADVFSIRLKYVESQRYTDNHKKGARHLEPKLMERPENATENLSQFACHER